MIDQALYERIMRRVRKDEATGCWIWTGPAWNDRPSPGNRYGYMAVKRPEKKRWMSVGTHKAMWWAVHGRPEKGLCVCHTCDNVLCCNPDHLWLGTHKENMADCRAKNRYHYAKQTHCKHGHEWTPENTYYIPTPGPYQGLRKCKACQLRMCRERYHKDVEAARAKAKMYRERRKAKAAGSCSETVNEQS